MLKAPSAKWTCK